jgi:hypothetical protein
MPVDRALRLIAGFFVLLSVALGYWIHPGWCPMMTIPRKAGLEG